MSNELQRLQHNSKKRIPLEQWGPYLSERQWGTVREDYSQHGDAWRLVGASTTELDQRLFA
jgi:hypothetical protein